MVPLTLSLSPTGEREGVRGRNRFYERGKECHEKSGKKGKKS